MQEALTTFNSTMQVRGRLARVTSQTPTPSIPTASIVKPYASVMLLPGP
jgi:hypothetical protein